MRAAVDRNRRGFGCAPDHGYGGHRWHARRNRDRDLFHPGNLLSGGDGLGRCESQRKRSRDAALTGARRLKMKLRSMFVLIAAGWTAGCTVGPNYQRPAMQIPQNFRAPDPLPAPQATSVADLKWWEVFKDEKLQDLIRTALAANYDLRDAVAR